MGGFASFKKAVKKAIADSTRKVRRTGTRGAQRLPKGGITTRVAKLFKGRKAKKRFGGTAASSISRPPVKRGQTADAILRERRRQARKHR